MPTPDYDHYFHDDAAAYERSAGDRVDSEGIRSFFAEAFIAAGMGGQVNAVSNGEAFEADDRGRPAA